MLFNVVLLSFAAATVLCVEDIVEKKDRPIHPTVMPFPKTTPTTTTTQAPTTQTQPTTTQPPTTPPTTTPTTSLPPTTPVPTNATTTSSPITTTPSPETPWIIKNDTGFVCMIAKAGIHIDIPYTMKNNKTGIAKVDVNKGASASGTCKEHNETMNLKWGEGNNLTITFTLNETSKQYWVNSMVANIPVTPTIFPNISGSIPTFVLKHVGMEFITPLNNTYTCSSELQLNMNISNSNKTARLSLTELKLDAFHTSSDTKFSSAYECEKDRQTPDIVPIAVGCAIAVLIIAVLIAYLVSRRRTQARGYLSM